jgi:hypothetical protein
MQRRISIAELVYGFALQKPHSDTKGLSLRYYSQDVPSLLFVSARLLQVTHRRKHDLCL